MKLKTSTNVVGAVIGGCNSSAQSVNHFAINYKCLYNQSVVIKNHDVFTFNNNNIY